MKSFEFHSVPRVIFGRGEFRRIGESAADLGRFAMVVYNGPGVVERLIELLDASGVKSIVRRQRGEPVGSNVDAGLDEARRHGCDLVIGLGGGSAIDAAKA